MTDPRKIIIKTRKDVEEVPDEVFCRAISLLWPEEGKEKISTRDVVFILKKEFGRRACFICDLLLPENNEEFK